VELTVASIGFIGTGTISGAMVEGLSRQSPALEIVVSPRSETVSRGLAERYPNVRRAASNAEVAMAEIVVLGMRPAQLEAALTGLDFGPEQIVLSLVAGLALADVQKLAPSSRVARAVPMPGIARATGPLTLYPDVPELVELLAPLGDLFVVGSETELNMGGLSALMSSYFELMNRLIALAISSGVEPEEAKQFVVSLFGMLADTARRTPTDQFGKLVEEHQTKGGLNERVRSKLLASGWFETLPEALTDITSLSWTKLG
jgi:pyrroline-5-carboxylate reductase